MRKTFLFGMGSALVAGAVVLVACSSTDGGNAGLGSGGSGAGASGGTGNFGGFGNTGNAGGGAATGGTPGIIDAGPGKEGGGGGGTTCDSGPDEDKDQDGFSVNQGDCNDCDANVNPGAIDVYDDGGDGGAPKWGDEDCSGTPGDSAAVDCDDGIALDDPDPVNAAKSIELCKQTTQADKSWGVISANWVRADGTPYGTPTPAMGIEDAWGPNVNTQAGKRMLVLSSGHARLPGQADSCGTLTCYNNGPGTAPPGFPQDVPSCTGDTDINDDVGLEVKLRAPTNATGYAFNFRFYSFEYPEWVCTSFNDQFIALVNPAPQGSINGNICFDSQNNPVSVNVGFFDVCQGCPAGTAELQGTGFDTWDDAGATVWLESQAPVTGGQEVTIRFTIWDTGDQAWDSTALIDNFHWIANGGTVAVGTKPIPTPR